MRLSQMPTHPFFFPPTTSRIQHFVNGKIQEQEHMPYNYLSIIIIIIVMYKSV